MAKVKCSECGRLVENPHYINGKPYGYNCYKQKLAIIYKQWEDEKNAEYSVKCFSAMQIFQGKRSNSFHDSICKQWNDCKKLTAKQLACITKGFTTKEKIDFWIIWHSLTNDEMTKKSIPSWIESEIRKTIGSFENYINDDAFINCMLQSREYKKGLHFFSDIDCGDKVFMAENGEVLKANLEDQEDGYIKILKVVESNSK